VDGPVGRGALRLVARALAAGSRRGAWVATVDVPGTLYPPGLYAAGVNLERLLVVRPPSPGLAIRAMEELLRHGSFPLVVLLGLDPGPPQARRLLLAAEAGRSVGVLVQAGATRAPCATRLRVERIGGRLTVEVVRRQGGPAGESFVMEPDDGEDGVRLASTLPPAAPAARAAGARR